MHRINMQRLSPTLGIWGLSIAIWSSLSVFTAWQYWIAKPEHSRTFTFVSSLIVAEEKAVAFALLTPVIFGIVRRHPIQGKGHFALYYFLGVGPFMLLCSTIEWMVLRFGAEQYAWLNRSGPIDLIRRGFADQIIAYIAIVGIAHAYEYLQKANKEVIERCQIQAALTASELRVLKAELRPHFLFNTLHGISTLIDEDSHTAKTMVIKVCDLLRMVLERRRSDLVSLREEVNFVRDYLDLEKMRFGERLTVKLSVPKDTEHLLVPQLILQPLVENAVRHGIASSRRPGWVEIIAGKSNGYLTIRIANSTAGKCNSGTGLGLKNTAARVRYHYLDRATFSFRESTDGVATAMLTLPTETVQLKERSFRTNAMELGG